MGAQQKHMLHVTEHESCTGPLTSNNFDDIIDTLTYEVVFKVEDATTLDTCSVVDFVDAFTEYALWNRISWSSVDFGEVHLLMPVVTLANVDSLECILKFSSDGHYVVKCPRIPPSVDINTICSKRSIKDAVCALLTTLEQLDGLWNEIRDLYASEIAIKHPVEASHAFSEFVLESEDGGEEILVSVNPLNSADVPTILKNGQPFSVDLAMWTEQMSTQSLASNLLRLFPNLRLKSILEETVDDHQMEESLCCNLCGRVTESSGRLTCENCDTKVHEDCILLKLILDNERFTVDKMHVPCPSCNHILHVNIK